MIQERIQEKLTSTFAPAHLDVVNESHMHSVKPGSETHFKVLVVSAGFEGKSRIDRHRAVNEALREELRAGLHALTIRALSPAEWQADGAVSFVSPQCLGGSKAAG